MISTGRTRAIAYLQEALVLNPQIDLAHQQLGHAYLAKGRGDDAIAAFETAAAARGARDSAHLAYGYARVGRRQEARVILDRLLAVPEQQEQLALHLAMAHTGLGDHDAAFRLLMRGADARASFMDGVMIAPVFAPLHADPRWPRLLAAIGLASARR